MKDGAWYARSTRMWLMWIDGTEWRDDNGTVRWFVTADEARDAAEREVYGPRREARNVMPCGHTDHWCTPTVCKVPNQ